MPPLQALGGHGALRQGLGGTPGLCGLAELIHFSVPHSPPPEMKGLQQSRGLPVSQHGLALRTLPPQGGWRAWTLLLQLVGRLI